MAEKRTKEQIDALNRINSMNNPNADIIPYDDDETILAKQKEEKEKEEEKNKAEVEAQKKADEIAAQLLKEEEEKKKKPAESKQPEFELDDDKVLEYLNKKGKQFSSLEDLLNPKVEPTEEQKRKLAEQREADKVAFGLSKGLFSRKQLEEYITDTKNPEALVYAAYAKQQKEKDPTLTDEDIKGEFNSIFHLEEEKGTRLYESGQNNIANIAENIINKKHAKILNLENDFSNYEKSETFKKEAESNIKKQLPLYNKAIDNISNSLKKISIPVSDKIVLEVPLEEGEINEIISDMRNKKYAESQIQKGFTEESLMSIAQTTAIITKLPKLLNKYAEDRELEKQAGLRGIKVPGKEASREKVEVELTDDQKKAISIMQEKMIAN